MKKTLVILTKEVNCWSPWPLRWRQLAKIIVAPPIVERRISETADGVAGDAAEMVRVVGDAPKGWTRCPAAASLRIELVGKHSVTRGSHS